jgi:hypothetical protein
MKMSQLKNQSELAKKSCSVWNRRESKLVLLQNSLQKIFLELLGVRDYNPQPRRISFKLSGDLSPGPRRQRTQGLASFSLNPFVIKIDTFRAEST